MIFMKKSEMGLRLGLECGQEIASSQCFICTDKGSSGRTFIFSNPFCFLFFVCLERIQLKFGLNLFYLFQAEKC